ncbi:hypothetical protein CfE428DRAFT_1613 [Chthoniobacter flavus Ellin428]|uniref:Uncharacterized protein n=1 Tax=Chthoniobacter flavus Ellin428 TaxID=497964 RepID=B4CX00_9BACT|nr:hypothetical protein CfE428DRAFT_1613 [Chthoniobacter flavus Ellin428]TCO84911.1 hypothetical protein EV701_13331 [Chthoniobacter flavus]
MNFLFLLRLFVAIPDPAFAVQPFNMRRAAS